MIIFDFLKLAGSLQNIDEIKHFVYCTAVKYSDRLTTSLGTYLLPLLNITGSSNDKEIQHIIVGLGCSTNETIIARFIIEYL